MASLAAMLLPAMAKAKERARQAVCFSKMRQTTLAHKLYPDDHDMIFLMHGKQVAPRGATFWHQLEGHLLA